MAARRGAKAGALLGGKGAKAVVSRFTVTVGAGSAAPAPPLGPALGQVGASTARQEQQPPRCDVQTERKDNMREPEKQGEGETTRDRR